MKEIKAFLLKIKRAIEKSIIARKGMLRKQRAVKKEYGEYDPDDYLNRYINYPNEEEEGQSKKNLTNWEEREKSRD